MSTGRNLYGSPTVNALHANAGQTVAWGILSLGHATQNETGLVLVKKFEDSLILASSLDFLYCRILQKAQDTEGHSPGRTGMKGRMV